MSSSNSTRRWSSQAWFACVLIGMVVLILAVLLLAVVAAIAVLLLNFMDPHGEMHLGRGEMSDLIADIDLLLQQATPGPEHRGLMRLRAMAFWCRDQDGRLAFIGD